MSIIIILNGNIIIIFTIVAIQVNITRLSTPLTQLKTSVKFFRYTHAQCYYHVKTITQIVRDTYEEGEKNDTI